MALTVRLFLILYGLIAVSTGYMSITATYDPDTTPFEDNSHRFIGAIWAATSLGFFYCAFNLEEITLFRFLMLALFIGGIVRAVACIHYPPDMPILATIFLELVPTPILWWLHTKLLENVSL
ncbi:MAG: DUF4345 domain-containing protein [Bacteroidota bacterium]